MGILRGRIIGLFLLVYATSPAKAMLTSKIVQRFNQLKAAQRFQTNRPQANTLEATPKNIQTPQQSWEDWFKSFTRPSISRSENNTSSNASSPFSKKKHNTFPKSAASSWNPFKALSSLTTNVSTTMQTIKADVNSTTQSTKIIFQIRHAGYVANSVKKDVQTFLENNNSDAIKNVVDELFKHSSGARFLQPLCVKNSGLARKLLAVIQEPLINPILTKTLPTQPFSPKLQDPLHLVSTILLKSCQSTDTTQISIINTIQKNLLTVFMHHPLYVIYIDITVLSAILPNDVESFISLINQWDSSLDKDILPVDTIDQLYKKSFMLTLSTLLGQKINNELNKENKEKLCTIICEKEYAKQIVDQFYLGDKVEVDAITNILVAVEKKLLTNDTYTNNFCELIRSVRNAIHYSNHIYDETKKTIQKSREPSFNESFSTTSPANRLEEKNLTIAIKRQFNKIARTTAGIRLLKDLYTTSEFSQKYSAFLKKEFDLDITYANPPSFKHLEKYGREVSETFPIIFNDSHIKTMIQSVLQKEKEENERGNKTFFHGRRWEYGFSSYVYKILFELKSGEKLNNFEFTHLDDPALGKISQTFFTSAKAKREQLLKEGNPFPNETKTNPLSIAKRQALLFVNKFLFGNTKRLGSSSIDYILKNHNQGEKEFSITEVFAMFGYTDIYQQYAQKLQELQQQYNSLSNYGELLLISIPKDKLNKCVYYTTSGGPKKSFIISDICETTNTEQIVDYLDKNPQDIGEFVIINTPDEDGGLNPKSGINVFPFNAVDPEKWKQFEAKRDEVINPIVQAIKQKESLKQAKKIEEKIQSTRE